MKNRKPRPATGEGNLDRYENPAVGDAGNVEACHKVEHSGLRTWAEQKQAEKNLTQIGPS
jgi:hypothetical protein